MINHKTIKALMLLLVGLILFSSTQAAESDYRLKQNDVVRLTVFQEPDLASTEKLTIAGEVSFPLIGTVRLEGLTLEEAEKKVTDFYNKDYLVEPKLSINLVTAADATITILGAVNNPGTQQIAPDSTLDLVTALDSAGGLTAVANENQIELKRGNQTYTYTLSSLRARGSKQIVLLDGDRINIPVSPFANKTVTILGEVRSPGPKAYPVSGQLDLDVLLAMAGGPTPNASLQDIQIKRNGNIISGVIGRQQRLFPNDLITIPVSAFVGKFVSLTGRIARSGDVPFPLDGQMDLLSCIAKAGGFDRLANKKKVLVTRNVDGENKTWRFDCNAMSRGKVDLFYLEPGDKVHIEERLF